MDLQDFASLMSGATVIITDCSIQVFCGKVGQNGQGGADEEELGYQTNAIGFMADQQPPEVEELEEELEEDDEEEVEDC
jgi:hypothetical protein